MKTVEMKASALAYYRPNPWLDLVCWWHYVQYGREVTQCRCDPEVVLVHLFTLATMQKHSKTQ